MNIPACWCWATRPARLCHFLDWLRVNDSLAGLAQVETAVPLIPAGRQIACVYVWLHRPAGGALQIVRGGVPQYCGRRQAGVAGGRWPVFGGGDVTDPAYVRTRIRCVVAAHSRGGCLSPEVPFFRQTW